MTRRSLVGVLLLVLTILLGSTTILHLAQQLAPALVSAVTVAWLALYVVVFAGLMIGHGINWISWLVRYRLLLVILMLGTIASISWALDTRLSLERVVHLIGCTLIAIYIGFTVPLLTTLRVLAVTLGVLFVASVLAALALPAIGIEDYAGTTVWRGLFNTKNTLGFWSAIGVLLYVTLSDSVHSFGARVACFVMAAISLALLVFSHSATSLVAMLLAGALTFYLFVALRFRLGFVRMVVLAVLLGGLAFFAVSNISTTELVGRSTDLTGRGEVWAQTWRLIMQRPATGFGYGVLWFPAGDTNYIQETLTDFTWTVHHAHNGFLQVASEIGLPLAVVALLMIAQQLIEIFYCQYQRQQAGVLFVLAFTVAYLITNVAEARFLVNRELFWILFIALPISMLRQINVMAPDAAPVRSGRDATARQPIAPLRPVHPMSAIVAAAAAAGRAQNRTVAPWQGATRDESPWIALAEEQRRLESERIEAERDSALEAAARDGELDESFDTSLDESLDESWTEDDFNATVEALTLTDADIDLGVAGDADLSMDDSMDVAVADESRLDIDPVDGIEHTIDEDVLRDALDASSDEPLDGTHDEIALALSRDPRSAG